MGRIDAKSETLIPIGGFFDGPGLAVTLPANENAPIAFTMKDYGADAGDVAPTLRSGNHDKSHANGGVMPAVAFDARQSDVLQYGEKTGPLDTDGHTMGVLTVNFRGREGGTQAELGGEVATAVRAGGGTSSKSHVLAHGVRRLTPTECERLQGFPDSWTAVTYRNKPAADGPRYKAIGNSMAVPVVRWILSRLEIVDGLLGGH